MSICVLLVVYVLYSCFQVRALHSYVTVAALLRPVTEASRLRTAKDLAALEALLSGLHPIADPESCPVLREYR